MPDPWPGLVYPVDICGDGSRPERCDSSSTGGRCDSCGVEKDRAELIKPYRCRAGHIGPYDDGRCHAAVFGEECGLDLLAERAACAHENRAWCVGGPGDGEGFVKCGDCGMALHPDDDDRPASE